jgi:hypothetical protein
MVKIIERHFEIFLRNLNFQFAHWDLWIEIEIIKLAKNLTYF